MQQAAVSAPADARIGVLQPFTVFAIFMLLLFATGGSSWSYEGQLIVLRPAAVLVAAWGFATMRAHHWREYRTLWVLVLAMTLLIAAHLIPLPFAVWSSLPGRDVLAQIDVAAGLGKIARPLSMQPEATINALLSLTVPLAVMSIGVQLDDVEQRRAAGLLTVLIGISTLVGFMQLAGINLMLYENVAAIRPSGLFNNRNHQGALIAMAFPLTVVAWKGGYISGMSAKVERIFATGLAVLVLPLSFVTGSRSGLFLCAIALVSALVAMRNILRRAGKYAWLTLPASVAGLGALAVATVLAGRADSIARLDGSTEDVRFPLWKSIVDFLPDYMPWGSGVGTYAPVYQIHEPDALLAPTFSNHAHNEVLEIALTAGIPGLIVLVLAIVALAGGAIRVWRNRYMVPALQQTGLSIILLLALASTTDYPVRTPILFGVLSLAAVWLSRASEKASVTTES